MCDKNEFKKVDREAIIFRSYCMESGEVGDWCVEPYCEKCGNLAEDQVDLGDTSEGMTEAWYIPVCGVCGRVLPHQEKIEKEKYP